ncbi:MAG: hypothetical protein JW895_16540 [Thermoleophilaceae bacterium]|nr:hypothetical protein [Thermoleophilaceae bacterium]
MALALPAAALGAREYERPARPVLKSLDHRIKAERGSMCWTTTEDGETTSVCGDVFPPQRSKPLKVRPGGAIRIDMRMPTERLTAWLGDRRTLIAKRLGEDGRRWRVRLPGKLRSKATLSLLAVYSQGDSAFTATLRRRNRP